MNYHNAHIKSPLTPTEINILLGKHLKQIRRLTQMTQEMLAKLLGVTFQQVQKYEKGTSAIRVDTLLAIAHHLGVHPGFLLQPVPFVPKGQSLSERNIEINQLQRLQTAFYSFKPPLREQIVVLCEMVASLNFFEELLIQAKIKNITDSIKNVLSQKDRVGSIRSKKHTVTDMSGFENDVSFEDPNDLKNKRGKKLKKPDHRGMAKKLKKE